MPESGTTSRDEALTRWLNGTWTKEQAAVIGIACNMAKKARKPWWRRRQPHPVDFIPAARDAVTILLTQGWTPPGPASDVGKSDPDENVGPCARCGHNPACGFASIDGDWLCHDDDHSCYFEDSVDRATSGSEASA